MKSNNLRHIDLEVNWKDLVSFLRSSETMFADIIREFENWRYRKLMLLPSLSLSYRISCHIPREQSSWNIARKLSFYCHDNIVDTTLYWGFRDIDMFGKISTWILCDIPVNTLAEVMIKWNWIDVTKSCPTFRLNIINSIEKNYDDSHNEVNYNLLNLGLIPAIYYLRVPRKYVIFNYLDEKVIPDVMIDYDDDLMPIDCSNPNTPKWYVKVMVIYY